MAEGRPETTITEDVVKAISVPGSTSRQGMINLLDGKAIESNMLDVLAGRKEVTPQDLVNKLEDRFNLDLTAGGRHSSQQTAADKTINFIRDVVVDIGTSPDSLIGLPAKGLKALTSMSKLGKAVDAVDTVAGLSKGFTRKATERAATGATLGALSIQDDDGVGEALAKIGTGAVAGAGLSPAFKATGKFIGKAGSEVVSDAIESANKAVFKGTGMSFNDAVLRAEKAEKKAKPFARIYEKLAHKVDNDFYDGMKLRGFSDEAIELKFNEANTVLEEGFSSFTKKRNEFREILTEQHGWPFSKAHKEATKEANKIVTKNVQDSVLRDADLSHVIDAHILKNRKLAEVYNNEIKRRASKLTGFEKRKMLSKQFTPIDLHTLDFKALDDIDGVARSTGDIKTGAQIRLSDVVEGAEGKLTPQELRIIGAQRFARLFANEQEKQAQTILAGLFENKLKLKSTPFSELKNLDSGNSVFRDAARKMLDTHDSLLQLIKTTHLATGASWAKTNYVDNIIKAYIAHNGATAFRVATEIPPQAAQALADKLTGGALANFTKKNTFQKLMNGFDPDTAKSALNFEDQWIDAASEFGAVDSNKYIDFRKMIGDSPELLKLVKGKKGAKLIEDVERNRGIIKKSTDYIDSKFWDTIGMVGSGSEAMARNIVFRDVAESLTKKYPAFGDVLSRKNGLKNTLDKGFRVRGQEFIGGEKVATEVLQTRRALKEAAAIVNDTFFDYTDINTFEKHVMKRIFPYWSFLSKNTGFFLDKAFDADVIGKISKSQKLFAQSGRLPTEEERQVLPTYIRDKGVRIRDDGSIVFQSPESSPLEAVKVVTGGNNPLSMTNPIFKSIFLELWPNKDTFTGRAIRPTIDEPLVPVPESALHLLGDENLESIGVFRDQSTGRTVTGSTAVAVLNKIVKDLVPFIPPKIADEFARGRKKARFTEGLTRESDINMSALGEVVSPVKVRSFTDKEKAKQKKRSDRNIRKSQAETSEEAFARDKRELKTRLKRRKRGTRGARKTRKR